MRISKKLMEKWDCESCSNKMEQDFENEDGECRLGSIPSIKPPKRSSPGGSSIFSERKILKNCPSRKD